MIAGNPASIDCNDEHCGDLPKDRGRIPDHTNEAEPPHHFVHDGITVRVSFAGMADLNELVKGLFLTG